MTLNMEARVLKGRLAREKGGVATFMTALPLPVVEGVEYGQGGMSDKPHQGHSCYPDCPSIQ